MEKSKGGESKGGKNNRHLFRSNRHTEAAAPSSGARSSRQSRADKEGQKPRQSVQELQETIRDRDHSSSKKLQGHAREVPRKQRQRQETTTTLRQIKPSTSIKRERANVGKIADTLPTAGNEYSPNRQRTRQDKTRQDKTSRQTSQAREVRENPAQGARKERRARQKGSKAERQKSRMSDGGVRRSPQAFCPNTCSSRSQFRRVLVLFQIPLSLLRASSSSPAKRDPRGKLAVGSL